jgi:hypothetical protein
MLWEEKLPYEISDSHWANVVATITSDDSDDLMVIMMVMLKDLDVTAQWLGKNNLVPFGLDWSSISHYHI